MFTIKYNERNIFVYTGLEGYLRQGTVNDTFEKKDTAQTENSTWTIMSDRARGRRNDVFLFKDGAFLFSERGMNRMANIYNNEKFVNRKSNDIFSLNVLSNYEIDSRLDSILSCYIQETRDDIGDDINNLKLSLNLCYIGPDYSMAKFIISQTYRKDDLFSDYRNSPLFYLNYRGCRLYLFTGLEYVIWTDGKKANLPSEDPKRWRKEETWACDFSSDKIRVYKSKTVYEEGEIGRAHV